MTKFEHDSRLEELSALVRYGRPIPLEQALEVIEYQRARSQAEKKNRTWRERLKRWFRVVFGGGYV